MLKKGILIIISWYLIIFSSDRPFRSWYLCLLIMTVHWAKESKEKRSEVPRNQAEGAGLRDRILVSWLRMFCLLQGLSLSFALSKRTKWVFNRGCSDFKNRKVTVYESCNNPISYFLFLDRYALITWSKEEEREYVLLAYHSYPFPNYLFFFLIIFPER